MSSAARIPVLADVPTFAESGLPGFETTAWWAVFGPPNLPSKIADKLNDEVARIARSDTMRQKLGAFGVLTIGGPRDELAAFQLREIEKWDKAVKASGAKPD